MRVPWVPVWCPSINWGTIGLRNGLTTDETVSLWYFHPFQLNMFLLFSFENLFFEPSWPIGWKKIQHFRNITFVIYWRLTNLNLKTHQKPKFSLVTKWVVVCMSYVSACQKVSGCAQFCWNRGVGDTLTPFCACSLLQPFVAGDKMENISFDVYTPTKKNKFSNWRLAAIFFFIFLSFVEETPKIKR